MIHMPPNGDVKQQLPKEIIDMILNERRRVSAEAKFGATGKVGLLRKIQRSNFRGAARSFTTQNSGVPVRVIAIPGFTAKDVIALLHFLPDGTTLFGLKKDSVLDAEGNFSSPNGEGFFVRNNEIVIPIPPTKFYPYAFGGPYTENLIEKPPQWVRLDEYDEATIPLLREVGKLRPLTERWFDPVPPFTYK